MDRGIECNHMSTSKRRAICASQFLLPPLAPPLKKKTHTPSVTCGYDVKHQYFKYLVANIHHNSN